MYFSEHGGESGRKVSGIALTAAFHLGLVYALLHGAGYKVLEVVQSPVLVKLVEEIKKPPEEPPKVLPQPDLAAPPKVVVQLPYIPPPEVAVQPQPQQLALTSTQVKPPEAILPTNIVVKPSVDAEPAAKAAGPVVVPAVVNFDTPGCRPEWPRSSIRNDETGTVGLAVLIGPDGSVADARIERSSGFRNLDNAVKAQLLSGSCKNKPGTVDGKPQQLWIKVIYVWKLTDYETAAHSKQ
ncbi:MAG: TonB family protein [Pseudomonadota bacterium]